MSVTDNKIANDGNANGVEPDNGIPADAAPFGSISSRTARVVWIYNDVPPGVVAGASIMAQNWMEKLPTFGLTPKLFAPSGSYWNRGRAGELVHFRTLRHIGYPGDWHARFSLFAELARVRERPDAIIVSTPLRVGILGLATASVHGIPLIVVHSTDMSTISEYFGSIRAMASTVTKLIGLGLVSKTVWRSFWRPNAMLAAFRSRRHAGVITVHGMRAIYSVADAVVVLGEKSRREIDTWEIDVPVHTISLGVDALPVRISPITVEWPSGRLRLLYVGRLSREKNVPLIVRGLRNAVDRGVDAHVVLCGDGHMEGQLRGLIADLDLTDRVDIVGPFSRDQLQSVYASAEVFVFPSKADAQAMALNEAAHEGLPIIGCDPLVNAVLADGISGLVTEDDPAAWGAAIEAMSDSALRRQLGERAREIANLASEKSQLAKLTKVIHDAIDGAEFRSGT